MKQKPPHIDKETQTLIAMSLPDAMAKAFESYNEFYDREPPTDVKEFGDYHNSSKAVLAHIQLLAKMAEMVDYKDDNQAVEMMQKILNQGQIELEGKDE